MKRLLSPLSLIMLSFLFAACAGNAPAGPPKTIESSPSTEAPLSTATPKLVGSPGTETADLIFYGGEIITMDPNQPVAQALAILGEKILALGSDEAILEMQSPETNMVDLQGRTIMPGFVDAHSHLFSNAADWGLDFEGAQNLSLRQGITTTANMFSDQTFVENMIAFDAGNSLKIRTSIYLNYTSNCGDLMGDWYTQYPVSRNSGEMLRIGGVKIFTDGGSCGAPAFSYDHPVLGFGNLWFTQEELNTAIAEVHEQGYQAAIHALGDRAVDQALNAIEFTLDGEPNNARHRIEHNALVRDDMVSRYGEIGVLPLIFGSYGLCHSSDSRFPPPPADQDGWEWRWRDLIDANPNVRFAWHSDMHVPIFGQISPLQHLFSMTTPLEVNSDGVTICETAEWVADKTLTVEEALPIMTINSAYALFRDEEVGSLEPAKYADFIILSGNPLTVNRKEIIDLQVLMTSVAGKVEFCMPGNEALCPASKTSTTPAAPLAWDFETADSLAGWEDGNQHSVLYTDRGSLIIETTGPDPWVYLPPSLNIDAESLSQIEIRMKLGAGFTGQLFFLPGNSYSFTEASSVRFDLIADDQFHTYTIDMTSADAWQGPVNRIRLDPVDASTTVEIDYIRIVSAQ